MRRIRRDCHFIITQGRTIMNVLQTAQELYTEELRHTPKALGYLLERGIPLEAINDFGIGLAPASWNYIAGDKRDLTDEDKDELVKYGVLKENESGHRYDFFRNRIVIPVLVDNGDSVDTVGFSCRLFDTNDTTYNKKGAGKYINSPASEKFQKSEILFNFLKHKAGQYVVLVEGVMDVILLAQLGIYAVAPLGTSFTKEQAQILADNDMKVMVMFDGDNAGRNASEKALKLLMEVKQDWEHLEMVWISSPDDDAGSIAKSIMDRGLTAKNIVDYATKMTPDHFMLTKALYDQGRKMESVEDVSSVILKIDNYPDQKYVQAARNRVNEIACDSDLAMTNPQSAEQEIMSMTLEKLKAEDAELEAGETSKDDRTDDEEVNQPRGGKPIIQEETASEIIHVVDNWET